MKKRTERPDDKDGQKRGEPGSEDEFARGAGETGAPEIGADVEEATADSYETLPIEGAADAASELVTLERELSDQREKFLRLAAEYDNFRKRTQRERVEAGSRAQADLVRQLLDALDDLGRFAHLAPAATDSTTVIEGAQMVEKKLEKALGAAGLEVLDPVDQSFDPAVHEAVATEAALSPEDDNVIARVFQRGYVFNGQLLRPARVVVKQWNG